MPQNETLISSMIHFLNINFKQLVFRWNKGPTVQWKRTERRVFGVQLLNNEKMCLRQGLK